MDIKNLKKVNARLHQIITDLEKENERLFNLFIQ